MPAGGRRGERPYFTAHPPLALHTWATQSDGCPVQKIESRFGFSRPLSPPAPVPMSPRPALYRPSLALALCLALPLVACGDGPAPDTSGEAGQEAQTQAVGSPEAAPGIAVADPQAAWWANLSAPCGDAFPGSLGYAPPGDAMLQGEELLVVHFDVCEANEIRLPFHIEGLDGEWDRSRTWIFRQTGDGRIELRHDHRMPDGTEDEQTWYGAWTIDEGSPTEQRFIIQDREWPDGEPRGWRVIIEPGERYTYGTIRGDEWSWRVDFDLSEPTDTPPPAWGYEDGAGPPR